MPLFTPSIRNGFNISALIEGAAKTSWGKHLVERAERNRVIYRTTSDLIEGSGSGEYRRGQGLKRDTIVLTEDADEDILIHELAHHQQDENGYFDQNFLNPTAYVLFQTGLEGDARVWVALHRHEKNAEEEQPLLQTASNAFDEFTHHSQSFFRCNYTLRYLNFMKS